MVLLTSKSLHRLIGVGYVLKKNHLQDTITLNIENKLKKHVLIEEFFFVFYPITFINNS